MKTQPLSSAFYFLTIFLFTLCTNLKVNAQAVPPQSPVFGDPHRGISVDNFVTFTNQSLNSAPDYVIDTAHTILSVWTPARGYYKETELLEYCRDNHITHLMLYNLVKVFKPSNGYPDYRAHAWDNAHQIMQPLTWHLCRFMEMAYNPANGYGITEISAAGSTSEFLTTVVNPSPDFHFTEQEKNSPGFNPELLFVEDSNNNGTYAAQVTKYFLTVLGMGDNCDHCDQHFTSITFEDEFWNGSGSFDDISVALKDLYFLKLLNNTLNPDHQIQIEMYLGALKDGSTSWSSDMIAAYLDGCTSCKAFFDIGGNSNYPAPHPRIVDKILPTVFESHIDPNTYVQHFAYVQQASCYTPYLFNSDPNACGGIVNYDHTLIYPYMNAESREQGGKADFLGKWFRENMDYNGIATNETVRNIFNAERAIYISYLQNENPGNSCAFENPEDRLNIIYPGGMQWYASEQMYKALKKPVIFTTNSPLEENINKPLIIYYQGPMEEGTHIHFTVGTHVFNADIPALNCDFASSDPEAQLEQLLPNYLLTEGTYTAEMTLTFTNNLSYTYSRTVNIGSSSMPVPFIEIINDRTPIDADKDIRCEGDPVTLKIDDSPFSLRKDGLPWTGSISAEGYIADDDVGEHIYSASFDGFITSVQCTITWNQNPNIYIVADEADCANIGSGPVRLHTITLGNGASGGIQYKWSTEEEGPDITAQLSDYGTAPNGESPEYQVTATSPLGCTRTAIYTVGSTYTPAAVNVSAPVAPATCTGTGSITISVPATTNHTDLLFITPGNQFIQGEGISHPFDLVPGTYTYYSASTYNGGCTQTGIFTIPTHSGMALTSSNVIDATGCTDGTVIGTHIFHDTPDATGAFTVSVTGGTGDYDYTIYPQGITTTTASTTHTFTALAPGDYRVEVRDNNDDCTAFIIVTVGYNYDNKPRIKKVSTDDITCAATTTLAHIGYGWGYTGAGGVVKFYNEDCSSQSGSNCPSCQACSICSQSLSPGIYNVLLTDAAGCDAVRTFYISNPPEMHIELTADPSCDNGADNGVIHVDACGGYGGNVPTNFDYFCVITGTTTNAGNISLNGVITSLPPGTYTVTAKDHSCPSLTISADITITEQPCCTNAANFTVPTGGLIINSNTDPATLAEFTPSQHHTIDVNGDITVQYGQLFYIYGVTMNFAPGKGIIVLQNAWLSISSSTLTACDENWQGITAHDYANVFVETSTLTLANEAVSGNTYFLLSLTDNTFDNNIVDLHLSNGNFANAVITGNQFLYSALAAYDPQMPEAHIRLENVDGVTIGGAAALAGRNHFEKKQYGIKAAVSNVNVYNNEFYNCGVSDAEVINTYGGGVYSKGGGSAASNTLDVSDNGGRTPANYFYQCYIGVEGYELSRAVVENNTGISTTTCGFKKCKHAVIINNTHLDNTIGYIYNISVANNEMEEYKDAVSCIGMDKNVGFNVSNNLLNYTAGSALIWDAQFKHGYKAINVQNFGQSPVRGIIKNNLISNTSYGIHLRNIAPPAFGDVIIGDITAATASNRVDYLGNVMGVSSSHCFGYWFENCDLLEVDNNLATCDQTPAAGIDKIFRGFSVDNTTNSIFCTNKAEKLGSGVRVSNMCTGTYFKGTNTTGNWHNFHLANADFPWQDGTGHDLRNSWTNAGSTFDFAGSLSSAVALLTWYTYDYLTTTKEGGLGLQNLSINNQTSGYSNDCQTAQAPADDKRKEYFGRAVTDTTDYGEDFAEENKYQDKEAFYKAALKDSTILTLGLPDDVVFQNTFDSLSQTNIAAIADVKQLLDSDNVASALAVNSTIAPSNSIETNSKAAHQLLAAYIQNDSLTTAQKEDAHSIGVQTALEGGLDVYTMRALLNEDIVDDIDASANMRRAHHTDDVKKESVKNRDKLYPNPSANSVTLTSKVEFSNDDVLTVYDLLQQTIAEYKLVAKSTNYSFDISWLQQGVYYVKHIRGSTIVSENKLVVIR